MVLILIDHYNTHFMKELLQKIIDLNELRINFMEKVKKNEVQLEQIFLILKKQQVICIQVVMIQEQLKEDSIIKQGVQYKLMERKLPGLKLLFMILK